MVITLESAHDRGSHADPTGRGQGYCIVCHNGMQAAGKTPGHVATTLECGDCHTTTNLARREF